MALGYCMECKRLVSIRPTSRFEGGPLDYVPIRHYNMCCIKCGARAEQYDEGPCDFRCFGGCGDLWFDEVERVECDGHKFPIR